MSICITITIEPDTAEQYRQKLPDDQLANGLAMALEATLDNNGWPISSFQIDTQPRYIEPPI